MLSIHGDAAANRLADAALTGTWARNYITVTFTLWPALLTTVPVLIRHQAALPLAETPCQRGAHSMPNAVHHNNVHNAITIMQISTLFSV
jgi:hypothetical protein